MPALMQRGEGDLERGTARARNRREENSYVDSQEHRKYLLAGLYRTKAVHAGSDAAGRRRFRARNSACPKSTRGKQLRRFSRASQVPVGGIVSYKGSACRL